MINNEQTLVEVITRADIISLERILQLSPRFLSMRYLICYSRTIRFSGVTRSVGSLTTLFATSSSPSRKVGSLTVNYYPTAWIAWPELSHTGEPGTAYIFPTWKISSSSFLGFFSLLQVRHDGIDTRRSGISWTQIAAETPRNKWNCIALNVSNRKWYAQPRDCYTSPRTRQSGFKL